LKVRYIIRQPLLRNQVRDLEIEDPLHLPRRGDEVRLSYEDGHEVFIVNQLTHIPEEDLVLVQLDADSLYRPRGQ